MTRRGERATIPRRDWLRVQAGVDPESLALIDARTDARWSYGPLDAAVEELAGRLSAIGVGPGDRVAVLVPAGEAFVRLVFATMRLGAVLVPLDRRLADPERAMRCELIDPAVLVVTDETRHEALVVADSTPVAVLDSSAGENDAAHSTSASAIDLGSIEPAPVDPHQWRSDDPLCALFTSGTTGDPKAVVLTVENVHASAIASAARLGVCPDDRWLVPLPTYHMGGLAPIYRSAIYGTAVVLQPFDAAAVSRVMEAVDVSGISLVPTTLRRLLDANAPLDRLRFVLVGGARTPPALVERSLDRAVPIYPTYGMTETASQIATARPDEAAAEPSTVGRPLSGTTVTVLDSDGESLPRESVGELVVSGPTVTPGYLDDPAATDRAFGPHGFHTGDVGYVSDDGLLYVRGRLDDRIVTGGENVHPAEVESVVHDHPDVREVAVVGLEDPTWGQRVSALVVPAEVGNLSVEDVVRFCDERLADYKRPRTIAFVDELPRTASGTVDRVAVRERLIDAGRDENGA